MSSVHLIEILKQKGAFLENGDWIRTKKEFKRASNKKFLIGRFQTLSKMKSSVCK
jgi:hypothetical protein